MRVLDTGVQTEPDGRRLAVRGVTGEDHPADPVALRQQRLHVPVGHMEQGQFQVGQSEDLTDLRGDLLLVEARRVARVEVEDPFLAVLAPGRAHLDEVAGEVRVIGVEEVGDEGALVPPR